MMINKIWDKICGIGRWFKRQWKKILVLVTGTVLIAQVLPTLTLEEQIIQEIEISQNSYFQKHGHYWQGLPTHTFIPNKEETLDNLSVKPYYQTKGWNDLMNLPDKLPFQIEVHQYKAPKDNYGYQIFIRGKDFERSIGYGVHSEYLTWENIKTATTTQ